MCSPPSGSRRDAVREAVLTGQGFAISSRWMFAPELTSGEVVPVPRYARECARLAAVILESIEREGWLCGLPSGVESPGLMTGLAGIGYGLLRLAAPERVPSVLTLDPPACAEMIKE